MMLYRAALSDLKMGESMLSKSLVALGCALLSTLSVASDAAVSQSTVTLSNFGYSVVDLKPFDWTAPSAAVRSTNSSVLIRTKTGGLSWDDDEVYFNDQRLLQNRADMPLAVTGTVFKSSNTGFSLSTTQTAAELASALPQNIALSSSAFFISKGMELFGSSEFNFRLAPNTAIVFEGDVVLSNQVDLSTLAPTLMPETSAGGFFRASVYSQVNISGSSYAEGYSGPNAPENQFEQFAASSNVSQELTQNGLLGIKGDGQVVQHFKLTFANSSDVYMVGSLNFLSSSAQSLSFGPLWSAVPEAQTWALMALGLLGVGVAVRRERRDACQPASIETA